MKHQRVREAIQAVRAEFADKLPDGVKSLYLFGSLTRAIYAPEQSDVNLLLVVNDNVNIHQVRDVFSPIWWRYRRTLGRAPLVANQASLGRHLELFPQWRNHLAKDGVLLLGESLGLTALPIHGAEIAADLSFQSMLASRALTPGLLPPDQKREAYLQLFRLSKRCKIPIGRHATPLELFITIQQHFRPLFQELEQYPSDPLPKGQKSPLVPDLLSIYRWDEDVIFVLPELSAGCLHAVKWAQLLEELGGKSQILHVTSAQQLQLIASHIHPLSYSLLGYQLEWGVDVLEEARIPKHLIMREAARLPSNLELDRFTNHYLTCEDSEIHDLVHDFQNQLLNVQLRHELLVRTQQLGQVMPPEPLPGRGERLATRISAIFDHARWWANYYHNRMQNYDP